jgi:hypothetical protein
MAEQLLVFDDAQLERALRDLGAQVAFPPTPELSGAVRQRLAEQPDGHVAWWRVGRGQGAAARWHAWWQTPRRRLAVSLLVLLMLLALALAALAVADRIGLRGVDIREVPSVAAPVGGQLSLGTPTTLDAVRRQVGFEVRVPQALGSPDEVYLRDFPSGGQVALVYRPRPDLPASAQTRVGALLTAFRGDVSGSVFAKGLPPGTRVEEVQVNGGRGYWIEGDAHLFFYIDAAGAMQTESQRLAGNVLLWEQGPLTYRLELPGAQDAAMRIATSLR